MARKLTIPLLCGEAKKFAEVESRHFESSIFGTTDGKAVGTYFEHKFQRYLKGRYKYVQGNSARGIDFPELGVDVKVTSIRQPQSSCPYKSARQKIFGLGYSLLVFVYEKTDDRKRKAGRLKVLHAVFVEKERTADFQMSKQLNDIIKNEGNIDDAMAFMMDRNLPVDEIEARKIAEEVIKNPPNIGYLTISNALQWRLQYSRIIEKAGKVAGLHKLV